MRGRPFLSRSRPLTETIMKPIRTKIAITALIVALVPMAALAIGFGDDLSSPISTNTYVSLSNVPQGGMAHVAVEVTMRSP